MGNAYGLCGDCGVFPARTTYRYNDDGLLTEKRVIQPGNKLIRLGQYAYDRRGRHTQEWVYGSDRYARDIKARVDGTNGLRSTRTLTIPTKTGSKPWKHVSLRIAI